MVSGNGRLTAWMRRWWLLLGTAVVCLAACSGDQRSSEALGVTSQSLTAAQQRILGFESVGAGSSDWAASSGTLSQSTRHVEGAASLAIANSGNTTITSAALSSLGAVADKLTLDLLLPANQPNPSWMGTVKIVVECPSQQLWSEGLAEYQLQGRPTEQFLRFEFPLSASTRSKLSTGTYTDLRFKILLNVASGPGPWLFDRLWVGAPDSGGSGGSGGAGGAGGGAGASGGGQAGSGGTPSAGDPILGFEDPANWTTNAGVLASSDTRVEGQHSVQVSNITYAEIISKPLSTLAAVGPAIGFDLSVPNPVGDVWWWGTAAISIDCPSRGIHGRWLGQQQLDGSTLDRFRRVEVMVPDDVKSALTSGSYTDLRVKVILTVPQGSGPYLLDRFTFAQQLPEPTPPGPSEALIKAVGFETLEAWKASAGTLALSSNALEGSSSLSLSNFTYAEVTSQRFSSLGSQIESPLTVNVWVPTPPGDWAGTIGLSLDVPSKGINWQWIGQHDLASLAPNTWHRLSFDLPQSTILSLRGSYGDLRFKLLINRPEQLNAFLVDELNLGKLKPLPAALVEDYVLPLPKGMTFTNVAVGQALVKRFRLADVLFPSSGGPITVLTPFAQTANVVAPRMGRNGGDATVTVGPWAGDVSAFLDVLGGPISGTAKAGRNVAASATTTFSNANLESFEAGRIHVEFPADLDNRQDIQAFSTGDGFTHELPPGDYGFVTVSPRTGGTFVLRSGVYRMRGLYIGGETPFIRADNSQGPIIIHVRDSLALFSGTWARTASDKHNVLLTYSGRKLGPALGFDGTLIAPRIEKLTTGRDPFGQGSLAGSVFVRAAELTDNRPIQFHPFERDDCGSLPNNGCGVFGCNTADADADGLYDCEEVPGEWADPGAFNGVRVRASEACQTDTAALCAGIGTIDEVSACAAARMPLVEQQLYAGWSLSGRALQGVGCQDEMSFWPPLEKCTTATTSAYDYSGFIQLKQSGTHCFDLPASGNVCGALFLNGAASGVTSATGRQCQDLSAGIYPIRWFIQSAQAQVLDSIKVTYCFTAGATCDPNDPIPASLLRPDYEAGGVCIGDEECPVLQYCSSQGSCVDRGGSGEDCAADEGCLPGLVCAFGAGPAYGRERGTGACVDSRCFMDPYEAGCFPDGAQCPCEPAVTCASNADCPGQEHCVSGGGDSYGLPGVDVCEPTSCPSDEECGSASSLCGACECTPNCASKTCGDARADGCYGECRGLCGPRAFGCNDDADCQDGYACIRGGAPRVGGAVGENVCLPRECLTPNSAAQACGTIDEPCGLCPAVDQVTACAGRECGRDPSYGLVCGPLNVPCVQGKLVTAFQAADLELDTADRPDIPKRTIEPLPVDEPETLEAPGALAGTFAVDARGSATYHIPIAIPPGRAGMEPQLSLEYSSKSGNGLAGVGWAVGGQSTIARCPKTSATDGWASPVMFEDTDAYCLDGQRLVTVHGSAPSGTVGAEYRTELDSFRKVKLVRGIDNVLFFRVYDKSGRVLDYGDSENSRSNRDFLLKGLVPKAWALSKVRDRAGNVIRYEYGKIDNAEARTRETSNHDTIEFFLSSVAYGGVESPRGDYDNRRVVKFEYEDGRPDYMEGFSPSGSRVNRSKRLRTITTAIANEELQAYEIAYRQAPLGLPESVRGGLGIGPVGPSRIHSITECSRKNGNKVCKRPTLFSYTDERGFLPNTSKFDFLPAGSKGPLIGLDFNGDGKEDFATTRYFSLGPAQWVIMINAGDRGNPSFREIITGAWARTQDSGEQAPCFSQGSVIDTNGDGREELIDLCRDARVINGSNRQAYRIWEFNGNEQNPGVQVRDIPVDGPSTSDPRAVMVDVDGDGLKDIFEATLPTKTTAKKGVAHYYRARPGGTFDSAPSGEIQPDDQWGFLFNFDIPNPDGPSIHVDRSPLLMTDIDGDGQTDVLVWRRKQNELEGESFIDTSGWARYFAYPDGSASWLPVASQTPLFNEKVVRDGAYKLLDINGDGLNDVIFLNKTPQLFLNGGGRFIPAGNPTYGTDPFLVARFTDYSLRNGLALDYDGDGADDLLRLVEPFKNDTANVYSTWLWDRTNTHDLDHDTLTLDTAPFNFNDPDRFFLTVQPHVKPITSDRGNHFPTFELADLDGDGSRDLIQLGNDGDLTVAYGKFGRENLLKSVVDALGKRIDVRYDSDSTFSDGSNERTYKAPTLCTHQDGLVRTKCVRNPGPLVSGYDIVAENIESWGSEADLRFRYRYEGARQGLFGRGWLGFQATIVEQLQPTIPQTLISRTEVYRDTETFVEGNLFPFAGLENLRVTISPTAQNQAEVQASAARVFVFRTWELANSSRGGRFPFVRTKVSDRYELLTGGGGGLLRVLKTTETVTDIDPYGNIKGSTVITDKAGAELVQTSYGAEFETTPDRVNDWLIGLRTKETIGERVFATSGPASEGVRTTAFSYDDLGLLATTTREPNASVDSSLYRRTAIDRADDVFRNVRRVTASGQWRDGTTLFEGTRSTSFQYDEEGIFRRRIIRHVGIDCPTDGVMNDTADSGFGVSCLLTDLKHDPRDGTLLGSVDPTGVGTRSGYDSFGRLVEVARPGESIKLGYFDADVTFDPWTRFVPGRLEVVAANLTTGARSRQLFDALGRVVQTSSLGLDGDEVLQETAYAWGGVVSRVTRPHLEDDRTQGETRHRYDDRWRPTRIDFADGTSTQILHGSPGNLKDSWAAVPGEVSFAGSIDPRLHTTVEFSDFRGNVLRSVDAASGVTSYRYDVFGTLGRIEDPQGNWTTVRSDPLGRTTEHGDSDTGLQSHKYTAFDEPFVHEDGVGSNTLRKRTYSYDGAGRLKTVETPDGVTTFSFDLGANAMGRLVESVGPTGQRQRYTYEAVPASANPVDNRAFVKTVTQVIDGEEYTTTLGYNEQNLLGRIEYPSSTPGRSFAVNQFYDSSGVLNRVTATNEDLAVPGEDALVWRRDATYQGQAVTDETFGNGAVTSYGFEADTGRLLSLVTRDRSGNALQDVQYLDYDDNGNLRHRRGSLHGRGQAQPTVVEEVFEHDALNRLTATTTGGTTTSVTYDSIGNIRSKPGVGAYEYFENGKTFRAHAVQSITRDGTKVMDLHYDDYGNVRHRSGEGVVGQSQDIEYTSFNLPRTVTFSNGDEVNYQYDAQQRRVLTTIGDCDGDDDCVRRVYAGGGYELETGQDATGAYQRHHYKVFVGSRQVAQVERELRGGTETERRHYIHADHLGSVQLITDEDSAPASVKSFSSFGSPEALEPATSAATRIRSGYTGHETDAETGLVNMGGRLYDARLGRVLQADPPFAEPPWSQGLNRYSYALNNPLNLIDPSGFFSDTTGPDGNREIVFDDDSLTAELPDSWETLEAQEAGSALPSSPAGRTQHEAEWESAKSLLTDREKVDYLLGSSSEADCGYAAMSCPSASDYPKNRSAHLDIDAMARDQQASWEARILHDAKIIQDGAITPTANVDDLLMPLKGAAGAVLGVVIAKKVATGAGAARSISRIAPGTLPQAEEMSLLRTLSHIDAGTTPTGALGKKWGTQFKNWGGDLPGLKGAASPYLEYRVLPPPGTTGAGPLRVVMDTSSGEMFYTWTHYGDTAVPAFVQIR